MEIILVGKLFYDYGVYCINVPVHHVSMQKGSISGKNDPAMAYLLVLFKFTEVFGNDNKWLCSYSQEFEKSLVPVLQQAVDKTLTTDQKRS